MTRRIDPGYVMFVRFFPCLDDDCRQMTEKKYNTPEEHEQAVIDIYETLDSGGYCTVTRFNEVETIKTKLQLWEFKI